MVSVDGIRNVKIKYNGIERKKRKQENRSNQETGIGFR
jgi:hypothetical protein